MYKEYLAAEWCEEDRTQLERCYRQSSCQELLKEKLMKPPDDLGFVHIFVPAEKPSLPLLLLHGTGGDERDLLGL